MNDGFHFPRFLPVLLACLAARDRSPLQAADANLPSATEVTAFMEKWKPVWKEKGLSGLQPMLRESNALALVIAANERQPEGQWCWALQTLFPPPSLQGAQAGRACRAWQQVHLAVAAAAEQSPANPDLQHNLRMTERNLGLAALASGQDPSLARRMAERLLRHATITNDWDRGNLIYEGHSLLGRAALREGKLEEARKELLLAGQTPGSPQLNSFGPRFDLARELLSHGEQADREAVTAFLDEVAKFWANPDREKYGPYREDKAKKRQDLEAWKEQIRVGKIPAHVNWR